MNDDYENVVNIILEQHKEIFERLAPFDTLEYDAAEYIINNKEALREKLKPFVKTHSDLFPPSLYEVYLHQFEEKAYEVILDEVAQSFNLDPENRLRITRSLIRKAAGDLLIPR